jgi:hypothetical protein
MNKFLIGATILVVSLALIIGVLQVLPNNEAQPTTPTGDAGVVPYFPPGEDVPMAIVTGDTLQLPLDGTEVSARNFLRDNDVSKDQVNFGFYYLGTSDISQLGDQAFTIQYIAQTGHFTLSLLREPLGPVRIQAENALVARLGLPKEQLCGLKYTVAVPGFVSAAASDIDYRFSFCPDAIPLE